MELEQRIIPKQERAKKTYNKILSTAESLLEEASFEKFTTKNIAQKANLRIRSIYRYFPNRLAIIKALAEQHAEKDLQVHHHFTIFGNPEVNWSEALDNLIDDHYTRQTHTPAYMAVRRALAGSPELMEYDEKTILTASNMLANSLKARMPDVDERKLKTISITLIEITDAMTFRAHKHLRTNKDAKKASEIIKELKFLLKSYLQNYIERS
jgi:AcrR family transcriptional regulator